jgi:uncharacterized repeat protein (TIGR03803 family)
MRPRIVSRALGRGFNISTLGRKSSWVRAASTRRAVLMSAALSALLLIAFQLAGGQATPSEAVLYSFAYTPDAGYAQGRLTFDSSGNLYGTTTNGGANSDGSVFELSPEPAGGCPSGSNPGSGWCETVLYSFCSVGGCTDGYYPEYAYVTFDNAGNLYGTTFYGGVNNEGTIFELSPEPLSGCPSGSNPGNGWCETVLYSFQGGTDATNPANGLVWDSAGNLYGAAYDGCNAGGCVYELSPNGSGGWIEQVIYPVYNWFTGLAIDSAGNLYGVDGMEHVFKLSFSNGAWTATNIHTFTGSPKDGYPGGGNGDSPAVDSAGNVYGTTYYGGTKNLGTVWKLTPVTTGKKAGTYTEKILHSFTSATTGEYPFAGVTLDSSGNIYGTTVPGGKYGYGTLFELAVSGTSYKEKLLWSFNNTDGSEPYANPILGSSGNLYGTTYDGGSSDYGTVFEFNPGAAATTTTLTSSPNPSTSGETVTFTATVSSSAGAPPDGESVNFMEGSTLLGTGTLSGGSAAFMTSSLPVGTSKIDAVYPGDGNFGGSTSKAVSQKVKN